VHLDFAESAPLIKRPGNGQPDRIYVGRSPDCDIVIRRPSISKSHAYFEKAREGWRVVDLGSHNRTAVGGAYLAEGQAARLSNGIAICFGVYLTFFLDAGRYYELLHDSQYCAP
jgi:pSer/pThr/pTyr-binding forkhead associated (FHA) protein